MRLLKQAKSQNDNHHLSEIKPESDIWRRNHRNGDNRSNSAVFRIINNGLRDDDNQYRKESEKLKLAAKRHLKSCRGARPARRDKSRGRRAYFAEDKRTNDGMTASIAAYHY